MLGQSLVVLDSSRNDLEEKSSITQHKFPAYPSIISKHLKPNGCLFDEAAIARVEGKLKDKPDGRYSKRDLDEEFGAIKYDDEIYAIYKSDEDVRFSKTPDHKIKIAQSIRTNRFYHLTVRNNDIGLLHDAQETLNALGIYASSIILREKNRDEAQHWQGNMLTEYYPGYTLDDLFALGYSFTAARTLSIACQAVTEVQQLHERGFLHLHLSNSSFMYDSMKDELKLTRFGLSQRMDENGQVKATRLLDPEQLLGDEFIDMIKKKDITFSEKSEVFALGCVFMDLFGYETNDAVIEYKDDEPYWVSKGKGQPNKKCALTRNQKIEDFICDKMMNDNPEQRPSLQSILDFFASLSNKLVPISLIETAIVDIHEYEKLSGVDRFNFRKCLAYLDEVALISFQQEVAVSLLDEVREEFTRDGLVLLNKYYVLPGPVEKADFVGLQHAIDQACSPNAIHSYCLLSRKYRPNKDIYSVCFRSDHHGVNHLVPNEMNQIFCNWNIEETNHIIRMLTLELETSPEDLDRNKLITSTIEEIERCRDAGSLTYYVLNRKMEALQKSLLAEKKHFVMFGRTNKVVEELCQHLKEVQVARPFTTQ